MDGEIEAVPGPGVSLSVHPHILVGCKVINGASGTALLPPKTSGPFRVLLAALKQCLVCKILIPT